MTKKGNLVLALEAGLNGGAISVLENGRQIDCAFGSGQISKSEDLLSLLEGLLGKNGLRRESLRRIVVSEAPGSLTGIRIGLAMARGLGDSLGVEVRVISILDAMARMAEHEGDLIVALDTKESGIFFRRCLVTAGQLLAVGEIDRIRDISGLFSFLEKVEKDEIFFVIDNVLQRKLKERLYSAEIKKKINIKTINGNHAEILGKSDYLGNDASDKDKE